MRNIIKNGFELLLLLFVIPFSAFSSEGDISYVTLTGTETVFIHVNDDTKKSDAFSRLGTWAEHWKFIYQGNLYLTMYKLDLEKLTRVTTEFDVAVIVSNKEITDKLEELRKEDQTERDEEFARQLAIASVYMSQLEIDKLELDYVTKKMDAMKRKLDLLKKGGKEAYDLIRQDLERIGLGKELNTGKISSGTYAKYIYKGPFEGIDNVWQSFIKKVNENKNYRIIDKPCFEIYSLSVEQGSLQELTIELYIPIAQK